MKFLLAIFPKPTTLIQPAKSSFNNPAFWKNFKLVQFTALNNFNICVNDFLDAVSKRFPDISTITKNITNTRQREPAELYHLDSAGFVRNIGRCHIKRMRQTFSVHSDMTLDPRNLFPRVIPFFPGCISVLNTLGIDDTETRRFSPSIVDTP